MFGWYLGAAIGLGLFLVALTSWDSLNRNPITRHDGGVLLMWLLAILDILLFGASFGAATS